MKIDTASGKSSVHFKVEGQCKPRNQTVTPLVMAAGMPDFVSTRLPCVEEGYAFWWPPYSKKPDICKPVNNCRPNARFTCITAKVKPMYPLSQ